MRAGRPGSGQWDRGASPRRGRHGASSVTTMISSCPLSENTRSYHLETRQLSLAARPVQQKKLDALPAGAGDQLFPRVRETLHCIAAQ